MSSAKEQPFKFAVPSGGFIFGEDVNQYTLCKPRLLPLRSVTLEKLEKLQKDAEDKLKAERSMNAGE